MFSNYATRKISPICKISTFFEDLSFLNPRNHLNLNDGFYRPYQNPHNIIQYLHAKSNHPPNIINQIPKANKKRLSQLSSNEEIFNESAPVYEDKLHQSGCQQ